MPKTTKPVDKSADAYGTDPREARAEKIRAVFKHKPVKVHDIVGPKESIRAAIMKMSLFPNIHNRETVMRYGE